MRLLVMVISEASGISHESSMIVVFEASARGSGLTLTRTRNKWICVTRLKAGLALAVFCSDNYLALHFSF